MASAPVGWHLAQWDAMWEAASGPTSSEQLPPLALVLCGAVGAGKSATANTLLGRAMFATQRSAAAVTTECHSAETVSPLDGRRIVVLDTPGLLDPDAAEGDIHVKIIAGVEALATVQPDTRFSVLLVASLAGRLDDSVLEAFFRLGLVFGRNLFDHATLVWTHGDLLLEETPEAAGSDAAGGEMDLERALAAYLSGASEDVSSWLGKLKGGSLCVRNRHGDLSTIQLERVAERALAVAGRASQLAPPKAHRKAGRRERQRAMLAQRHTGAAAAMKLDGGSSTSDSFSFGRLLACIYPASGVLEDPAVQADHSGGAVRVTCGLLERGSVPI